MTGIIRNENTPQMECKFSKPPQTTDERCVRLGGAVTGRRTAVAPFEAVKFMKLITLVSETPDAGEW